jgi:hypothetical protein
MGHFLSRQGFRVQLYEKSARIGGKIASHRLPEGVIEEAANAVFATPEIEQWLSSLGLTPLKTAPSLKRLIWDGQSRSALSIGLVLRILMRLFVKSPSITPATTVADFFRPLLGPYVETLLGPALQGIYATSAEKLTVKSLWPHLNEGHYLKVLGQLKGARARSVNFAGGMQSFVNKLAESIQGEIHLNHQAPFELRPNTIICTPAMEAAKLLDNSWPSGSMALKNITYLPIASVVYPQFTAPRSQGAFGQLFVQGRGIHSLGVLYNQQIFSHLAGTSFIVSSHSDPAPLVERDLARLNWQSSGPVHVHHWSHGLPLYNEARYEALERMVHDPTRPRELVLFGNYVAGISLREMIQVSKHFCEQAKVPF